MAATVQFSESNGAGETVTDGITNINLGSTDAPNLNAALHPVIINTNSFRKYIRFQLVALNTSTQIDTLGVYKVSGAYQPGEGIFSNCPRNGGLGYMFLPYATPSNSPLITNVDLLVTSAPGSPNLGINGSTGNALTAPGYSSYWVPQMNTTLATTLGPVNQKILAIQYNEF